MSVTKHNYEALKYMLKHDYTTEGKVPHEEFDGMDPNHGSQPQLKPQETPAGPAPTAPVFSTHPQDTTASVGTPVILTSVATDPSGLPVTYKWTKDNVDIASATSADYTVPDAAVDAQFRSVATNTEGTTISNPAHVVIS